MVRRLGFLCLLVFLTGCVLKPSYRAQQIRPAYPEMVVDCTLLGGVTGTSDIAYTEYGLQKAKYEALDKAAQLGATHIVWTELTDKIRATAQGRAYRCEDNRSSGAQDHSHEDYSSAYGMDYDSQWGNIGSK